MQRTLIYAILLIFSANSVLAQTVFSKEKGTITFPDGRTEAVQIFDENQRYFSQRVIVINEAGQKKTYTPEELTSFSVGSEKNGQHVYISKFYKGKQKFYQKIMSGKYPIYLYIDEETKRQYFFESELSNNDSGLIYLRDIHALQVIGEKFEIPIDTTTTLRRSKLIKVIGEINAKTNTPFQEYKKKANLRIGLSYSNVNRFALFRGSFYQLDATWQGRNNAKNFSYRGIVGLLAEELNSTYYFSSGAVWKLSRKRIQPYLYMGAGFAFLSNNNRLGFVVFPSLRPGVDIAITNDIALKAELVIFRPSFGVTYKIR